MAPKNRVIIDTDPGCDDVLALLLALSAPASELEVLLISVCFGNVDVQACTRNVMTLLSILDKEVEWRKQQGVPVGFDGVTKYKPIVALGATEPLHDRIESSDFFHGRDGLAGSHTTHPQFTPADSWRDLFAKSTPDSTSSKPSPYLTKAAEEKVDQPIDSSQPPKSFTPSLLPAHQEMLRLLRENEPSTITVIAIGPLTNLALAAAEDPITFLRAKEVVIMSGAVEIQGNVTPVAEFNVYADAVAAARVYALSSQLPASTLMNVPTITDTGISLPPYPLELDHPAKVTMLALDITEFHKLTREDFVAVSNPLAAQGSPLAEWMNAFMTPMLSKLEGLNEGAALALHDPMTVYYVLTQDQPGWKASAKSPEDVRVETRGEWTRGMTVGDRRIRKRRNSEGEAPHDRGNWMGKRSGNRVWRLLESPGREEAGRYLMRSLFGAVADALKVGG